MMKRKAPFKVGDRVRLLSNCGGSVVQNRIVYTVTEVWKAGSTSGCIVFATAPVCPTCGIQPNGLNGYDSGWFVLADPVSSRPVRAPIVRKDPIMEAIANKLHGIDGVPLKYRARMISNAARAALEAARKEVENGNT